MGNLRRIWSQVASLRRAIRTYSHLLCILIISPTYRFARLLENSYSYNSTPLTLLRLEKYWKSRSFGRFAHLSLLKKVATRGYLFLRAGTDIIDYLFKFVTIFYFIVKTKLHFADVTSNEFFVCLWRIKTINEYADAGILISLCEHVCKYIR